MAELASQAGGRAQCSPQPPPPLAQGEELMRQTERAAGGRTSGGGRTPGAKAGGFFLSYSGSAHPTVTLRVLGGVAPAAWLSQVHTPSRAQGWR
eukprot:1178081-Pleurochrysis_carterae.AAC.1